LKSPILILEDDPQVVIFLKYILESSYDLTICNDIESAKIEVFRKPFELIILDISLPDGDGIGFCKMLRELPSMSAVPILFLSSHADMDSKILGFSVGADDYIVKPCSASELRLRIEARLASVRRLQGFSRAQKIGSILINPEKNSVSIIKDGVENRVDLTLLEFRLLSLLAQSKGRILNREQIGESVWGKDFAVSDRSVDTLVSRIRSKIKIASDIVIQSHYGAGYSLDLIPL
jgi:DNA-binding response OmpR family regulator